MAPDSPTTVSSPKYLVDTDTHPGRTAQHVQDETASGTIESICTDGLPDWVRNSVPRLVRLCGLGSNWDSYGSPPPSFALVKGVVQLLGFAEIDDLPEPEIVPACGGGIQLEWYMGDRELEIEFTPDGRIEYLATDNRAGGEVEEELRDLDDVRFRLLWVAQKA